MENVDELKQMILSFRVSELTSLLGFAGRNKLGRKIELQKRAIDLVEAVNSPALHCKIRKLHEAFQLQLQNDALEVASKTGDNNLYNSIGAQIINNPNITVTATSNMHPRGGYPSYPPVQQHPSLHSQQQQQRGSMYQNNPYQQQHQYQAAAKLPNTQFPVHPDVKLKLLPFYDYISELIKPSSLVPQGSQRQQEGTYMFHLTPQQADAIATSRDVRPGKPVEFSTQIQLRFCLLETTSEQDDAFPPGIQVKVNQKLCTLPNPLPPTKPGAEPKRPPRPLNITSLCKLSPISPNAIQVQWATDYTRGYVLTVHLVEKRSSEDLLARLKARGVRAADYTRGMIKDKLKEDGEIATTSLRVSIACPLGKMRMTTPCRALSCNHFQCFDASLFLQMNEKKPQWMCPVCNKPAVYDKLVIDGYFQDVLDSTGLTADCTEIQLYMDGSWSAMAAFKKDQSCLVEKVEPPPAPAPAPVPCAKKEPPKVEVPMEVKPTADESVQIVTLSDSDDEPLMPRKKTAPEISFNANSVISDAPKMSNPVPQQNTPSVITLDEEDSPVMSPVGGLQNFPANFSLAPDVDITPSYRY